MTRLINGGAAALLAGILGACVLGGGESKPATVEITGIRSPRSGTLLVTWSAVATAHYTAYWSTDSAAPLSRWNRVDNLSQEDPLFDSKWEPIGYRHEFIHLRNGVTHYFRIAADAGGAPGPIHPGVPVIAGPDSIRLYSGNRRAILEWKDARPGIRHSVHRSADGGSFVRLEAGPAGIVDSGLENNRDYRYLVTAQDSVCESLPADTLIIRPTPLSEWESVPGNAPPKSASYEYVPHDGKLLEFGYTPADAFSSWNPAKIIIRFSADLTHWGFLPFPDSLAKDARIVKHGDAFYLFRSRQTGYAAGGPKYSLDIFRSTDVAAWEKTATLPAGIPPPSEALALGPRVLLHQAHHECRTADMQAVVCDSIARYGPDPGWPPHVFLRVGDSLFDFEERNYGTVRYATSDLAAWKREEVAWLTTRMEFPPGFHNQNVSRPRIRKPIHFKGWFWDLADVDEGVLLYSADGIRWGYAQMKPVSRGSQTPANLFASGDEVRMYLSVIGGTSGWFRRLGAD